MRVGKLGRRVDELAAAKIWSVEPDVQNVEESQELRLWIVTCHLLDRTRPSPHLVWCSSSMSTPGGKGCEACQSRRNKPERQRSHDPPFVLGDL